LPAPPKSGGGGTEWDIIILYDSNSVHGERKAASMGLKHSPIRMGQGKTVRGAEGVFGRRRDAFVSPPKKKSQPSDQQLGKNRPPTKGRSTRYLLEGGGEPVDAVLVFQKSEKLIYYIDQRIIIGRGGGKDWVVL